MLDISRDIDSLSNFKRKTSDFVRRLKKNGHPVVLTVNGKPEVVVQDAASYQKMLESVERLETMEAIKEGLADFAAGKSKSATEVHARLRKQYEL